MNMETSLTWALFLQMDCVGWLSCVICDIGTFRFCVSIWTIPKSKWEDITLSDLVMLSHLHERFFIVQISIEYRLQYQLVKDNHHYLTWVQSIWELSSIKRRLRFSSYETKIIEPFKSTNFQPQPRVSSRSSSLLIIAWITSPSWYTIRLTAHKIAWKEDRVHFVLRKRKLVYTFWAKNLPAIRFLSSIRSILARSDWRLLISSSSSFLRAAFWENKSISSV